MFLSQNLPKVDKYSDTSNSEYYSKPSDFNIPPLKFPVKQKISRKEYSKIENTKPKSRSSIKKVIEPITRNQRFKSSNGKINGSHASFKLFSKICLFINTAPVLSNYNDSSAERSKMRLCNHLKSDPSSPLSLNMVKRKELRENLL